MLRVYLTVDTEIWCGGWHDLDRRFPDAFRRYVHGPTAHGDHALPRLLRTLGDHGLTAVFFTEPLFALRFGPEPLAEMVGMIRAAGQPVELHLHPEWLDELDESPVEGPGGKRQFVRDYTEDEQVTLLNLGRELLLQAGAPAIHAFRAGSFGAGTSTLRALARAGIGIDSSFNPCIPSNAEAFGTATVHRQAVELDGVLELPVSVLDDGRGLRHLQLGACSFDELRFALEAAERAGWESVVLFLHNFELMNPDRTRADPIVTRRFDRLCAWLDRHRDRFETCGLDRPPPPFAGAAVPLRSHWLRTGWRFAEQAARRVVAR